MDKVYKTSNLRMVVLILKIISWYAHKQKDNTEEEKINFEEKFPIKSLFKAKKNKKVNEEKEQ
jgi:hypothetical protein